jgi:hypothetical protein
MRISLLLVAVVLSACSDDPKAPLTPGGGGPQVGHEDRPDSGGTVDDTDAGSTPDAGEGPMPFECTRIDPVMYASDEIPSVTATSLPLDFKVSRQVARFAGDCPNPSLLVELSNGICPNGQGHELEFWFPANLIADGAIGLGLNTIDAESATAGIRVRYTRPERYSAAGEYGNCDGSSGTLSFYDAPDVSRPMNLRATYELSLVPCDGKTNPMQRVVGFFDVRVRRDLAATCPP